MQRGGGGGAREDPQAPGRQNCVRGHAEPEAAAGLGWILRDGDTVLFSAIATRRKVLNLARDPRVSLTVFDTANPYQSAEIRGTAEVTEDPGKRLPRELSQKYLGEDPPPEPDEVARVIVRVVPERVNSFSP